MLVCLECWQKKEECQCKTANNSIMQYVEIDDRIYPAIRNLNLLGYQTSFCCEGHTDERHTIQAYITFVCDKSEKMFEVLPEGWQYESYNYRKVKHYKYNIIRSIIPDSRQIKRLTTEQKQKIINANINSLIKWTESLQQRREGR